VGDSPGHDEVDVAKSSSRDIAPIRGIWRLRASGGIVRSNALPDIDSLPSRIPDPTLRASGPVNVELPDACGVGDESRHVWQQDSWRKKGYMK